MNEVSLNISHNFDYVSLITFDTNIDIMGNNITYMLDYLTLFQFHLKPASVIKFVEDILNSSHKDYTIKDVVFPAFMSNKTHLSMGDVNSNLLKIYNPKCFDYTKAKNLYNKFILNKKIGSFVEFTLPTIVGKLVKDFIFLLSQICGNIKLSKSSSDLWLIDRFVFSGTIEYNSVDVFKEDSETTQLFDESVYINNTFLSEWKEFSTNMKKNMYKYHKTLIFSIDTNNINNKYQQELKNINKGTSTGKNAKTY